MIVSKEFLIEEVVFKMGADWHYDPVRGSLESGDPEYEDQEREEEDKIIAELEAGNIWAWCIVTVTASWAGFLGKARVGGVSIILEDGSDPEESFVKDYGYYESLVSDAVDNLKANMAELGWSIND